MYRKIFCILLFIQILYFNNSFAGTLHVYLSGEKCLLDLPKEMLGREFLVISRMDSVFDYQSYQPWSKLGEEFVVTFRQNEQESIGVYLLDYRLREGKSSMEMGRLLARNQVECPVVNCPVVKNDSEHVVIDITKMLMTEAPFFDCSGKKVTSCYGESAAFCCVVMREMSVVRRKWKQQNDEMTELPVTTTFFLLPEHPWQARKADRRVGFASLSYNYFKDERSGMQTENLIQRWALEPKDKVTYQASLLCEPICPIVFYLDPSIPEKWRPYFIQAVEDWQLAFEAAGFRKAIVAREMPKTRNETLPLYRGMIYYQDTLKTEVVDVNADPRSGEIIQACVHWSPAILDSLKYEWLTRSALWQKKFTLECMPKEIIGEFIRVTLGQRIGIALGLLPNELLVKNYSEEQLRDCLWLSEHNGGAFLMGRVMLNTVARVEDHVKPKNLFPHVGNYERWAMNWGYRYWQEESEGEPIRMRWLEEYVQKPEYWWFARSESSLVKTVANSGYLGKEPVRGADGALENVKRVFNQEGLVKVKGDTTGWSAWVHCAGSQSGVLYSITLPVLQQIGGIVMLPDTNNGCVLIPYPVERDTQKEAVQFLKQNVFATPQWIQHSRLVKKAGVSPAKIILDWQCAVLEFLFNERISCFALNNLMEQIAPPYSINEFMNDLYESIWSNVGEKNVDENQMALWEHYVHIVESQLKKNPRENVSVALQIHLNKVKRIVDRMAAEYGKNQNTWIDLKKKIENVLK